MQRDLHGPIRKAPNLTRPELRQEHPLNFVQCLTPNLEGLQLVICKFDGTANRFLLQPDQLALTSAKIDLATHQTLLAVAPS